MPWDEEKFVRPAVPKTPARREAPDDDRERRHAARRFFRAAPPYCIEFDADGTAMLCQKFYEYWPDREPEQATTWRLVSRHQDLEDAERRLRLICGGPIYYDAEGRVVSNSPRRTPRWDMPPADDE